mgnify:CR=1 FL=1
MSPDELCFSMTHNSDTMEHILNRLNHSDRSVVLLEKGKKIGRGFESGTSWPVLGELGRLGVPFLKNTLVTAITISGVDATETKKDSTQVSHHYDADCVIVASGVHSDDALTARKLPSAGQGHSGHQGRGRNWSDRLTSAQIRGCCTLRRPLFLHILQVSGGFFTEPQICSILSP